MFEKLIYDKKYNLFFQKIVQRFILNSNYRVPIMRNLKAVYRNSVHHDVAELIQKKYNDSYCIFSRYGLGDIFFFAGLAKEFKKTHDGKFVIFTEKKKLVPFIKAFPSVDEVVCIPEIKCFQEIHCIQQKMVKGKLLPLFYPYRGELETIVFKDNHANMLEVPRGAKFELPTITDKNYKNAEKEFERLKLNPQRTIVLIPEAVMFDHRTMPPQVWMKFADKLIQMGYDVVINSKDKIYKSYKTTFLPVMDFLAFLKQVKHTFSFRSGINDVMVGINITNLTAIYPPHLEVIWGDPILLWNFHKDCKKIYENEFDNVFHIYSLNSNFNRNDIHEYVYNYNYDIFESDMLKYLEVKEN